MLLEDIGYEKKGETFQESICSKGVSEYVMLVSDVHDSWYSYEDENQSVQVLAIIA